MARASGGTAPDLGEYPSAGRGPPPGIVLRWLPSLAALRRYDRRWLRGDVLAGVTVAAYLVPQVMAYAEVAGLPPAAGLWAAMAALALYVVFGSSPQLSIGPESTTAIMTATVVGPMAAGNPARYAALSAMLALAVAMWCLLARILRLGLVADLLSRPVLVGYMAGVACLMISSQLGKLTGIEVEGDSFLQQTASFMRNLGAIHVPTAVLAAIVLAFLFVLDWRFPRAPGPLIAVLGAAAAVAVLGLQAAGVAVVGEIPSELPRPAIPHLSSDDLVQLALPAIGVALVGFNDNVITARVFAIRHRYRVDANAELLGLAAANVGAGLVQGFPVSSSGSRTVLGDSLGSRTQLFSVVALVMVLATLLFFGPMLAVFPSAALGAIVVYAAVQLFDVPAFRRLVRFRAAEALLAAVTVASVLVLGVLYGVVVAVALSVADLLVRVARPHTAVLGLVPHLAGMHDIDDYPEAETVPGLVVFRYDSPLFFANAHYFHLQALESLDTTRVGRGEVTSPVPTRWFLLNAEAIVEIDTTAADSLEELRRDLTERGIVMAMAHVKQELFRQLERDGTIDRIGRERMYPTLPVAVAAYRKWAETNPSAAAPDRRKAADQADHDH